MHGPADQTPAAANANGAANGASVGQTDNKEAVVSPVGNNRNESPPFDRSAKENKEESGSREAKEALHPSSSAAIIAKKKMEEEDDGMEMEGKSNRTETKETTGEPKRGGAAIGMDIDAVAASSLPPETETEAETLDRAWFVKVIQVEKIMHNVRHNLPLPRVFALAVWTGACRWHSQRKSLGPILVETGGSSNSTLLNLASEACHSSVFSSGSLNMTIYNASNVISSKYGNDSCWIPSAACVKNYGKQFVGIKLGLPSVITSIAWRRSNGKLHTDRCLGDYTVQVTRVGNPTTDTPDSMWQTVLAVRYTRRFPPKPASRHRWQLRKPSPICTGVRIVVNARGGDDICINEIEIYGAPNGTVKADRKEDSTGSEPTTSLSAAYHSARSSKSDSLKAEGDSNHANASSRELPRVFSADISQDLEEFHRCSAMFTADMDADLVKLLNFRHEKDSIIPVH